jgi:hypothetical protein
MHGLPWPIVLSIPRRKVSWQGEWKILHGIVMEAENFVEKGWSLKWGMKSRENAGYL